MQDQRSQSNQTQQVEGGPGPEADDGETGQQDLPDQSSAATAQRQQDGGDQTSLSDALGMDLARARSNPLRVMGDLLLFRVLQFLARQAPPLPARIAARAERKARQFHPLRSLPGGIPADKDGQGGDTTVTARAARVGAGRAFDPQRATMMLVTHEASRSGAPILALNVGRILASKYNVVTILLGGGPLRPAFREVSTAVYELEKRVMSDRKITALVAAICKEHDLRFALINSVESRSVLPALKAAGVPTTILLHEFASYTRPRDAVPEVFENADRLVFSTRITLENALDSMGLDAGTKTLVLPQGKCEVPAGDANEAQRSAERARLDSLLKPAAGPDDDTFLVLGAGSVEPRKGVDLFIECATRVIRSPGGGRFRFVWIGHGYRPDKDKLDSAFLADQIDRAGIGTQIAILPATGEIEHAYRAADVLVLSSRLDPLPNVAIDALTAGTPVICFEHTTGIADFLIEAGLGPSCVAHYMDPGDMAAKVSALAADPGLHAQVKRTGQAAAQAYFDLEDYVRKLDAIASTVLPAAERLGQDAAFLQQSGAFDAAFFQLSDHGSAPKDDGACIARYLSASQSGQGMRKPCAGFNPLIYAQARLRREVCDPFVHYLREGRPDGPWHYPVIDSQSPVQPLPQGPVALHVHVRNLAGVEPILTRLAQNGATPDLVFSTVAGLEDDLSLALDRLGRRAEPVGVPARLGPLGALLAPPLADRLRDHAIVGHIHLPSDAMPDAHACDSLLGGGATGPMMDRILTAMGGQPDLGLVMPAVPDLPGWGKSRAAAAYLARRIGIDRLPPVIEPPLAGMFWTRGTVLAEALRLDLGPADFPAALQDDGSTIRDALPRLLSVLVAAQGLRVGVARAQGRVGDPGASGTGKG